MEDVTRIVPDIEELLVRLTPLNSAVLFIVFNRPDTTAKVFEAIRNARPARLYVASDGPRDGRVSESEKVASVRKLVTAVDWPCEMRTLFRDTNLGCTAAVTSAITWFFEHEERGIIIEDDCLPSPDFFSFCDTLLERYANDERVYAITGNNFQQGRRYGEASYYFSKFPHIWGWATWRRAWRHNLTDVTVCSRLIGSEFWQPLFSEKVERKAWEAKITRVSNAKEKLVWDYVWMFSVWHRGGLTATPNVNLVSNIGFGFDATHTRVASSPFSALPTCELGTITHPSSVAPNREADRYVFDHVFEGRKLRFPRSWLRAPLRVLRASYRALRSLQSTKNRIDTVCY